MENEDLNEKKVLLVGLIGHTGRYLRVNYTLNGKRNENWFSTRALQNILFANKTVEVLVIYPDNEDAKKGLTEGWEDREAIEKIFPQLHSLSVSESIFEGKSDFATLLLGFKQKLDEISRDEELDIIFDITHSFRHLSILSILQAMYMLDFDPSRYNIRAIYYAMGRQPLLSGDEVNFIELGSIARLVESTGKLTASIDNLNPKAILDFVSNVLENKRNLNKDQNIFVGKMSKALQGMATVLSLIQFGDVHDETFKKLDTLLDTTIEPAQGVEIMGWMVEMQLYLDYLISRLRIFRSQFNKSQTLPSVFIRQVILARHVLENQGDIGKSYAFMAEAFLTWAYSTVFNKPESMGSYEERKRVDEVIKGQFSFLADKTIKNNTLHGKMKSIVAAYSRISGRRNSYAHVMAGRNTQEKYQSRFSNANEDLKTLEELLKSEMDKSFYDFLVQELTLGGNI